MSMDHPELVGIADDDLSDAGERACPMLRDSRGHRVSYEDYGFACPVPEHTVTRVVDLRTAETVWERDNR